MEELAKLIQSYVDAYSDPDNESWADSRFYIGSQRAGDALVPSLRRHVARQIKENDDPDDACGGMLQVLAATVLALEAKSMLQEWIVLDMGRLAVAVLEAVGKERKLVAGSSRHWRLRRGDH